MPLTIGTRLGSYEIVGALGAGGMGEVFRARDTKLGREVAIKILPSSFAADPERLARFEREARLLASVNHPNIGAIYGVEERDGMTALVLELVEGETLAERLGRAGIRDSGLGIRDSLAIARQIADALDAAHERGIVHRDLKPANIVITPDGVVKVLDFGLAKAGGPGGPGGSGGPSGSGGSGGEAFSNSPTMIGPTMDGVLLGTAPYMSPEQTRGKAVDKRTDVWAFGCVLYEMLTGRRAFAGETTSDTIAAILDREPDWTALPPGTPAHVNHLVRCCLEKDAKRRLRDIGDARIHLDGSLFDDGRDPGAASGRSISRSSFARQSLAALIAFALGAGVVWWSARDRAVPVENPLANARFTRFTNFEGAELSAAISPDGKFVAFRSDREGPLDVWVSQVGTGQFVNLTHGIDDEFSRDTPSVGFNGTGSEIWLSGGPGRRLRLMPLMGGAPRAFLTDMTVTAAWSPDGTRVVYHTQDDGDPMFVADRTGANARQIHRVNPGLHNHFLMWSPDSRWVYFTSGMPDTKEMDVWRIAPSGGAAERLTQHNGDVGSPAPIDDHTVLYVAREQDGSGPWLWALDTARKRTRRVSFGLEKYTSVAATADGRRLVATVGNPGASLWRLPILLDRAAEERDVKPFPLPTADASAPRYGPQALFYLSSQGAGEGLWRYQDGQTLEVWKGADGALLAPPAVSLDGRKVAIVLRRDGKLRLHVASADGAELQPLADTIDVRGAPCWSPDAKWITVGGNESGKSGLFKIPSAGGAPIRLVEGPAFNPAWSPDGSLIVYAGRNVAAYAPLLAVRPDGGNAELPDIHIRRDGERVRFTPDGKALVYMQGLLRSQDFWLLDLVSRKTRPLSRLTGRDAMRTFDITPDGKHIVFDRLRENSDIVLIDLAR